MVWLEEIVQALRYHGGIASYSEIYEHIESHSPRQLTREWRATVRRTIEDHAPQSANFRGNDIFYSVDGIGRGVWGLSEMLPETPIANDIEEPLAPQSSDLVISRIIRDTTLTRQLKQLYKHMCQICRMTLRLPSQQYSEGHHLKPLGSPHHGPDKVPNVLIVCPNHHAEFDFGAIAIDPISHIVVHIDPDNPYHGRQTYVHPSHDLGRQYLEYHLQNIFNLPSGDASS
jgi:hypothetical protein